MIETIPIVAEMFKKYQPFRFAQGDTEPGRMYQLPLFCNYCTHTNIVSIVWDLICYLK